MDRGGGAELSGRWALVTGRYEPVLLTSPCGFVPPPKGLQGTSQGPSGKRGNRWARVCAGGFKRTARLVRMLSGFCSTRLN